MKWPPASKHREWHQFEEDATSIKSNICKEDADSHLQATAAIIVSFGEESFGREKEKSNRATYQMNHRAGRIHQLRQELQNPTQQYKSTGEEEKPSLVELRIILRKKLMTLQSGTSKGAG